MAVSADRKLVEDELSNLENIKVGEENLDQRLGSLRVDLARVRASVKALVDYRYSLDVLEGFDNLEALTGQLETDLGYIENSVQNNKTSDFKKSMLNLEKNLSTAEQVFEYLLSLMEELKDIDQVFGNIYREKGKGSGSIEYGLKVTVEITKEVYETSENVFTVIENIKSAINDILKQMNMHWEENDCDRFHTLSVEFAQIETLMEEIEEGAEKIKEEKDKFHS